MYYCYNYNQDLYHHGIKGMRWGIRRYQNEDGSYTAAGRKRYGLDLDVHDKSRKNIAKIRLGEARRRLDVAKLNNGTNKTRLAELKQRERAARRAVKEAGRIDAGAKRIAKGETITGNNIKSLVANGAATVASRGFTRYLNTRLTDLAAMGRATPQHYAVASALNIIGGLAVHGLAGAYSLKKEYDNANIRTYYNARNMGTLGANRMGSTEYADRVKKAKGKSK